MPGDEVLLCLFACSQADVRVVSERAGLPFERILACVAVGWLAGPEGTYQVHVNGSTGGSWSAAKA